METIFKVILLLVSFGLAGIAKADNDIMTPDGYLGHPAFELGVNGQSQSNGYIESYSYTNYANQATLTGTGNYNFNNIFVNVFYPVSPTFTLIAGGSFLVNSSGTSSWSETGNSFNGTENAVTNYTYPSNVTWFVSCRIYTK